MTPKQFVDFALVAFRCKKHKRVAWTAHKDDTGRQRVEHSIKDCEHVLGHTGGILILLELCRGVDLIGSYVDIDHCIQLALWHDVACEYGDGDSNGPHLAATEEERARLEGEKYKTEETAVKEFVAQLDDGLANRIYLLWYEYANKTSRAAKLVGQLDKLDFILTAVFYTLEGHTLPTDEFFRTGRRLVYHPWLIKVLNEMKSRI